MRKRFTLLVILSLLLAVWVVPASGQDDMIELRISWWGSQDRHDRTIAAIELYESENPNIDIVYEFQGWEDHWTKLATQAAGGELPDIMQQDYARIEEWVANGLLLPLDDYIASGVIDTTNISDASIEGGMVDGQLYGFNLGNNSQTVVLDIDAFEAAGLELPPQDWTWTQFEEIANTIHEELGIYAIGGLYTEQLWKNLYMSCCDAWSYNDEGTALGYDDDQPLIDFYNMLLRMQESGAMVSRETEVAMGDQGVEAQFIVPGEAAMSQIWSNQIVAVWTAAGEDRNFTMTHLPRSEGGQSANYIKPSMFWSITSQAQHPDESAAFIDWFTNSIEANEILFAERGVPISSAVREALLPQLEPAQREMFDFLARVEEDNSPIRPADPVAHADIQNNVWNPEFVDPVMYGLISPEEGAAILREEATRLLAAQ